MTYSVLYLRARYSIIEQKMTWYAAFFTISSTSRCRYYRKLSLPSPFICLFHFSKKLAGFRRNWTSLSSIASRVKSVRVKMYKNYFKSTVWSLCVRSARTWLVFQWYLVRLTRLWIRGFNIRWVQVVGFFRFYRFFCASRLEKMGRELLAGRRRRGLCYK